MSISSINIGMGASSWGAYNQKLTKETIEKLQKLNIPYTNSMSENQALALIKAKESQKNDKNEAFNQNENSQDNLFEKAKKLAKKIGVSVDKETSFEKLLEKIKTTLEIKISQNQENKDVLEQLKSYTKELNSIKSESNGTLGLFDNTNETLMMSLEMLGKYNKNMFLNY